MPPAAMADDLPAMAELSTVASSAIAVCGVVSVEWLVLRELLTVAPATVIELV